MVSVFNFIFWRRYGHLVSVFGVGMQLVAVFSGRFKSLYGHLVADFSDSFLGSIWKIGRLSLCVMLVPMSLDRYGSFRNTLNLLNAFKI